jgi:hypothetical protein
VLVIVTNHREPETKPKKKKEAWGAEANDDVPSVQHECNPM